MNGYKVIRRSRGLVFACDLCEFRLDLSLLSDNQPRSRTLGAAEMRKHIAREHPGAVKKTDIFDR